MKNILFPLVLNFLFLPASVSQTDAIPDWFYEELDAHIGVWITDNAAYMSETEPIEQFGMEWKMGIGGTSIIGRLYGIKDGKEIGNYWEFREYWDPVKRQAIIQQFGYGGMIGIGPVHNLGNGNFEAFPVFMEASGNSYEQKHVNVLVGNEMKSTSYNKTSSGGWEKDRYYVWYKQ